MALIGNYSVFNKSPARWTAGNATAHASGVCSGAVGKVRSSFNLSADWRKFAMQDQTGELGALVLQFAAKPAGYYPQGVYGLPNRAGGLSSYQARGAASVVGAGALGKNADATVSGAASSTAVLTGKAEVTATVAGSATTALVRYARGVMSAVSAGSGTATGVIGAALAGEAASAGAASSAATLAGAVNASGSASASASTTSTLRGLGGMAAASSGVASVSATITQGRPIAASAAGAATALLTRYARGLLAGVISAAAAVSATRYATGRLAGTIAPATLLDAQTFSAQVLDEELIETGMTVRQTLRLLAAVMGGEVSGAGGGEVTFRNALADNVARVVATVDASGNRSVVSLDLD